MNRPARLARARVSLARSELDAMLVAPSPDLVWLAGYDPPPLERPTVLVVGSEGDPVLLVPRLERALAVDSGAGDLASVRAWDDGEDPYAIVADLLGSARRVAVADRMWATHVLGIGAAAPRVALVATSEALPGLRAVKDAEEVTELARAAAGADAAYEQVTSGRFAGRSERDVADALATGLREHEHEAVAFTIVGAGPNGASPHHAPTAHAIGAGDPVVMDFGGRVRSGYHSDITRTVSVGDPAAQVRDVYAIVAEAHRAAVAAVGPGVPAEEVDRAARDVIAEAGYGPRFLHRTGHGIGLEEHEPPYLVAGNTAPLEAGMSFSIEPGIYLENRFGVRIEDIVVVTDDGVRSLNDADRALRTVG